MGGVHAHTSWLHRTHALETFSVILGVFTTGFGGLLLTFPERLHPAPPAPPLHTYSTVMRWASPQAWGILFALLGLCVIVSVVANTRAARLPLGLSTVLWCVWSFGILEPALSDGRALPSTWWAFMLPAVLSLVAAIMYLRDDQ